jgi:hypothetical protein
LYFFEIVDSHSRNGGGGILCSNLELRIFEHLVLGRIFGLKRDALTAEWRKLHEELHNLFSSPNVTIIERRRLRWAGHIARFGRKFLWKELARKT